ncbi:MAG: FecR domain-containing protein [Pyrinomonadaceae bacterium]|nr:FecR domain-containing protein [Pyrinomonadaceae bacterium]
MKKNLKIHLASALTIFALLFNSMGFYVLAQSGNRQDAIKPAIVKEVATYLNQFDGTCFGKVISIGEISKFSSALEKNVNHYYVGEEGKKRLKELSPNAESFHHTYKLIGMTADFAFPFDPANLEPFESSAEKKGYKNRQTMMHEVTHHIEWLNGVKESSKTVLGYENPRSERNTNYQDFVINALAKWAKSEELLKKDHNPLQYLTPWKTLEKSLDELEKGSAAKGNLHDANLEEMTGFRVKLQSIKTHYLSNICGEEFRNLVILADALPDFTKVLEVSGAKEIQLGESVELKTNLQDRGGFEVELDPELKPRLVWKISETESKTGNSISFKPVKAGTYSIKVEQLITVGKKDYSIAEGEYNLAVKGQSNVSKLVEWKAKWGSISAWVSGITSLKTSAVTNGTQFTGQANASNNIKIEGTVQADSAGGPGDIVSLDGEPVCTKNETDYKVKINIKSDGVSLYALSPTIPCAGGDAKFSYLFDPAKLPNKKNLTIEVTISGGRTEYGTGLLTGNIQLVSLEPTANPPTSIKPISNSTQGNKISSTNGQVTISNDGKNWNTTNTNANLKTGDQIKTGANSSANFTLADVISLILSGNSWLGITNDNKAAPQLKLFGGNVKISLPKGNNLKVEMSQAIATVKGTSFELTENGERSIVKVSEGVVEFRNKNTGETTNVSAGQSFVATPQGLGMILGTPQVQPSDEKQIFSTGNDYGVLNGGTSPSFTLRQAVIVTYIMTYHWNNGRGTTGGTITLKNQDGKLFGPWKVNVVNNVYWIVNPQVTLMPGTYTVIDSEPSTWAQNPNSGGKGHTIIKGIVLPD